MYPYPDPYHGAGTGIDPPHTPLPRVPLPTVLRRPVLRLRLSGVSEGCQWPTRLHCVTVAHPTYRLVENHHFLLTKMDLVKTARFPEFGRVLVGKYRILPFWHFSVKTTEFSTFLRHHCFTTVLAVSRSVRFPNVFWQISVNSQ